MQNTAEKVFGAVPEPGLRLCYAALPTTRSWGLNKEALRFIEIPPYSVLEEATTAGPIIDTSEACGRFEAHELRMARPFVKTPACCCSSKRPVLAISCSERHWQRS